MWTLSPKGLQMVSNSSDKRGLLDSLSNSTLHTQYSKDSLDVEMFSWMRVTKRIIVVWHSLQFIRPWRPVWIAVCAIGRGLVGANTRVFIHVWVLPLQFGGSYALYFIHSVNIWGREDGGEGNRNPIVEIVLEMSFQQCWRKISSLWFF